MMSQHPLCCLCSDVHLCNVYCRNVIKLCLASIYGYYESIPAAAQSRCDGKMKIHHERPREVGR